VRAGASAPARFRPPGAGGPRIPSLRRGVLHGTGGRPRNLFRDLAALLSPAATACDNAPVRGGGGASLPAPINREMLLGRIGDIGREPRTLRAQAALADLGDLDAYVQAVRALLVREDESG